MSKVLQKLKFVEYKITKYLLKNIVYFFFHTNLEDYSNKYLLHKSLYEL